MALVLAGVLSAMNASAALGAWQYRGTVADGHATAFQLVVRHAQGRPRVLLYAATGQLPLRCDGGGHRRARLETSDNQPLVDGHDFGFSGSGESIGSGGRVLRQTRESMSGHVTRRAAHGTVRLHLRVGEHRCDSGHLRWHADFVPRSARSSRS